MQYFLFILFISIIWTQYDMNGDYLNENPIHPIPEEMTFEEYQDMNRRISMGLMLSAIPIPGTIHKYAGELETAKKLRWIALGGIASIAIGLTIATEGEWEDSPYEIYILNVGEDNEIRYQMIPTGSIGDDQTYNYVELKKSSNKGGGLILLGMGVLIADYLYDYSHGIQIIENKRDKIRYKYGKKLDFSFLPQYDINNNSIGFKLTYKL